MNVDRADARLQIINISSTGFEIARRRPGGWILIYTPAWVVAEYDKDCLHFKQGQCLIFTENDFVDKQQQGQTNLPFYGGEWSSRRTVRPLIFLNIKRWQRQEQPVKRVYSLKGSRIKCCKWWLNLEDSQRQPPPFNIQVDISSQEEREINI